MSIVVENLSKHYGSQKAIDQLSFEAKKGEILGFLGPNGAGKSTTMKIATGYLAPTQGTVHICGHDVGTHSLKTKALVGYLPEHNPLYLDMYVQEYLAFVGKLHKISSQKLTKKMGEMIEMCGLEKEKRKKIGALSKGYRQRVGLAQALIHDPEVLILDEPTTGLDPNQIIEIREVIKAVSKEKTLIFSTHIMQEVQALCHRVVIINGGKIVADSSVENLQNRRSKIKIELEFEADFEMDLLKNLPISDIKNLGNYRYLLETETDLRSQIFSLVAQNGGVLIGINKKEESLEQIFHSLTS